MNFYAVALLLIAAYVYACDGAEIPPPTDLENGEVVRSYQGVNVYKTERACARQGGLCVHNTDCKSPTTKSGLCPHSAHLGVECCYEVKPVKGDRSCRDYLGECMTSCNAVNLRRPANDCEEDEICCVLV